MPYTTFVAAGVPGAESIQTTPNGGTGENDQFAAATTADGATWAVGWDINTSNHDPLILQSQNGVWSVVRRDGDGHRLRSDYGNSRRWHVGGWRNGAGERRGQLLDVHWISSVTVGLLARRGVVEGSGG